MVELLNPSMRSYVVNVSSREITLQRVENFEKLSFNTTDEFLDALRSIRKTKVRIWYVIPPGLIERP